MFEVAEYVNQGEPAYLGREWRLWRIALLRSSKKEGEWWIGYIEELPGANTQGRTLEEARENLKEAVALIIEANRKLAEREIEGKEVIREEFPITT